MKAVPFKWAATIHWQRPAKHLQYSIALQDGGEVLSGGPLSVLFSSFASFSAIHFLDWTPDLDVKHQKPISARKTDTINGQRSDLAPSKPWNIIFKLASIFRHASYADERELMSCCWCILWARAQCQSHQTRKLMQVWSKWAQSQRFWFLAAKQINLQCKSVRILTSTSVARRCWERLLWSSSVPGIQASSSSAEKSQGTKLHLCEKQGESCLWLHQGQCHLHPSTGFGLLSVIHQHKPQFGTQNPHFPKAE